MQKTHQIADRYSRRQAALLVAGLVLMAVLPASMAQPRKTGAPVAGSTDADIDDPNRLVVVQWNVENLFDNSDDPSNEGDDEYAPGGKRRWTDDLYRRKMTNLAAVIGRLQADVVCLQEVENLRVLEDLRKELKDTHGVALDAIVHREGKDHRGIDVAVLSRFEPTAVQWITPLEGQRDTLIATFSPEGHDLTILVNHWKSRRGSKQRNIELRMRQARAVGKVISEHLEKTPDAALILLGDFNDDITDDSLTKGVLSVSDRELVLDDPAGRLLYNLHASLPERLRGTTYYVRQDVWNTFDSMSVSRAMIDPKKTSGWQVQADSYEVYGPADLRNDKGWPKAFREVTTPDGGRVYQEGYSDHFPVLVTLALQ